MPNDPLNLLNPPTLLDLARFGIDLETEMISSPMARTIMARAVNDAQQAVYELIRVDPMNGVKVLQLQQKALMVVQLYQYLREQVEGGRSAADELVDRDES